MIVSHARGEKLMIRLCMQCHHNYIFRFHLNFFTWLKSQSPYAGTTAWRCTMPIQFYYLIYILALFTAATSSFSIYYELIASFFTSQQQQCMYMSICKNMYNSLSLSINFPRIFFVELFQFQFRVFRSHDSSTNIIIS